MKNEGGTIFLDLVKTHEILVLPSKLRNWGEGKYLKRDFIFILSLLTASDNMVPSLFYKKKDETYEF